MFATMADAPLSLLAIIDAIEQLTPGQRRRLQRRLYASGLFVPEVLLTDQNRLATAPALGGSFLEQRARRSHGEKPQRVAPSFVSNAAPPKATPIDPNAPYRSPVSGSVVLGTPKVEPQESDPHLMPPLPGQAPERPIGILVEAGSYVLRWPGESPHRVRLNFKTRVSEQEAYYDTLIHGLEVVERRLREGQADPQSARLDIRSDNEEFLRQAGSGGADLSPALQRVHRALNVQLQRFGGWRFYR